MTEVIHIKDAKEGDIYIGRGKGSIWGNPFVIGVDGTREEVIDKYRTYLLGNKELMEKIHGLKGKRLYCFCKPKYACHGDVIKEILDGTEE